MGLQRLALVAGKLPDLFTRCMSLKYVDIKMDSWMAKKRREQSTVSKSME